MFTGIVQAWAHPFGSSLNGGDVTMWIETGDVPLAGSGSAAASRSMAAA